MRIGAIAITMLFSVSTCLAQSLNDVELPRTDKFLLPAPSAPVIRAQNRTMTPSCALTASPHADRMAWELRWTSSYGASAVLRQTGESLSLEGFKVIRPTEYSIYTVFIEGPGGTVECSTFVHPFPPITLASVWSQAKELVYNWFGSTNIPRSERLWPGLFDALWWINFVWYAIAVGIPVLILLVLSLSIWLFRQRRQLRRLQERHLLTGLAHELGAAPSPQPAPPPRQHNSAEALRRKVAASLGEAPGGGNPRQGKVTSSNTFDV